MGLDKIVSCQNTFEKVNPAEHNLVRAMQVLFFEQAESHLSLQFYLMIACSECDAKVRMPKKNSSRRVHALYQKPSTHRACLARRVWPGVCFTGDLALTDRGDTPTCASVTSNSAVVPSLHANLPTPTASNVLCCAGTNPESIWTQRRSDHVYRRIVMLHLC